MGRLTPQPTEQVLYRERRARRTSVPRYLRAPGGVWARSSSKGWADDLSWLSVHGGVMAVPLYPDTVTHRKSVRASIVKSAHRRFLDVGTNYSSGVLYVEVLIGKAGEAR